MQQGFTASVAEEAAFDWLAGLGNAVATGPEIDFGQQRAVAACGCKR